MPFCVAGWRGISGLWPVLVVGELVVHWLGPFPGFRPGFADFLRASGPLSKVDHWLDDFPDFWPVFGDFLGASGPLFKVGH